MSIRCPDLLAFPLECYNFREYAGGMVIEVKLRKVGNSVGLVLPRDVLARLNAGEGDTVTLTEAPGGGLRMTLTTDGQEHFASQMKAAEKVIRRYRNTLRELAK